MISKLGNKASFKRHVGLLFLLVIAVISEVDGDNATLWGDGALWGNGEGANVNGDSSLCRVIRAAKRSLLTKFEEQYTASDALCDLNNHCANVTCSATFSRNKVDTGLALNLCQDDPELKFLVNIPERWHEPWSHTFSSKDLNGQVQRVEIKSNQKETTEQTKRPRWYIKVTFSITHGRISSNYATTYISIESVLQLCQNTSEESCTNTTLLNIPRLPQSQICDFTEDVVPGNSESTSSSSRSSRNANAFNPHELHRQAAENSMQSQKGESGTSKPGDPCDPESIFGCGHGLSCVVNVNGSAACECLLPDYIYNTTANMCVKRPPSKPSADPSSAESTNRSYSSALGAIFSILILVGIAAGIFYGVKYHVFVRIRHRLPVLRCWPFRRTPNWEDNVTMVNPLGPSEDDDPPLL